MSRRSQIFFSSGFPPAPGDVEIHGTSSLDSKFGNSTTHSWTHNYTADPTAGLGMLQLKSMNDTPVSGMTYDGDALTLIRQEGFGVSGASVYKRTETEGISTGNNTATVTFTGATDNAVGSGDSVKNVDQTTVIGNTNGQNGSLGSSSLSVTQSAGSLVVDACAEDFFDMSKTGGANQITLHLNTAASGDIKASSSYHSTQTAGSRTLGYTWSFTNDAGHVEWEILKQL